MAEHEKDVNEATVKLVSKLGQSRPDLAPVMAPLIKECLSYVAGDYANCECSGEALLDRLRVAERLAAMVRTDQYLDKFVEMNKNLN